MPSCSCDALLRRTLRDDEPQDERRRKELLIPLCVPLVFALSSAVLVNWLLRFGLQPLASRAGLAVIAAASGAGQGLAWAAARRSFPLRLVEAVLCATAVGIAMIDWDLIGTPSDARVWHCSVLALDGLLLVDASDRATRGTLAVVLLWLLTTCTEKASRWGLSRIDNWSAPQAAHYAERTSCADLPCATGWTSGAI
eukprot:gene54181-56167_t